MILFGFLKTLMHLMFADSLNFIFKISRVLILKKLNLVLWVIFAFWNVISNKDSIFINTGYFIFRIITFETLEQKCKTSWYTFSIRKNINLLITEYLKNKYRSWQKSILIVETNNKVLGITLLSNTIRAYWGCVYSFKYYLGY